MTAEDSGLLAHHDIGPVTGRSLVLVHGFTQTRHCWAPFDGLLAARDRLRLLDAPGHGASHHAHADLARAAQLVGATGGAATYVGYSMGGRITLRLALDAPGLVSRLVLIGASPGIADAGERAARAASDRALATRLETIGVAAFVDEWLAQPLFAGLRPDTAHRDERLRNSAPALAASLRALGTGAHEPMWHELGRLVVPVLLVAGADDPKFTSIAAEMCARIGTHAEVAIVEGAGHTAYLEQPEATADIVLSWLDRSG